MEKVFLIWWGEKGKAMCSLAAVIAPSSEDAIRKVAEAVREKWGIEIDGYAEDCAVTKPDIVVSGDILC